MLGSIQPTTTDEFPKAPNSIKKTASYSIKPWNAPTASVIAVQLPVVRGQAKEAPDAPVSSSTPNQLLRLNLKHAILLGRRLMTQSPHNAVLAQQSIESFQSDVYYLATADTHVTVTASVVNDASKSSTFDLERIVTEFRDAINIVMESVEKRNASWIHFEKEVAAVLGPVEVGLANGMTVWPIVWLKSDGFKRIVDYLESALKKVE
ncbi:hypothetical protein HDU79_010670 [Rhizoclosmatium sp. JEL0117]|nr:hypothetical protein HDU79_010670 [Rhizoclosmatium sp. JEL0117]